LAGYIYRSLTPQRSILPIAALAENAIDSLVRAHLELATRTSLASTIVTAVPGSADSVADLPLLLACSGLDNVSDILVTKALNLTVET